MLYLSFQDYGYVCIVRNISQGVLERCGFRHFNTISTTTLTASEEQESLGADQLWVLFIIVLPSYFLCCNDYRGTLIM